MLSHHLHTNTYNDIEIYGIEPYLSFLPTKKNWLQKYLVHGYINAFYLIAFHMMSIKFGHLDDNLVVVGVVNRGEGCARKDAIGIYARVKVCDYLI